MIKRFLPRGMLGRSLLIVLVPLLVLQAVTFTIFYGGHLDFVSRRLTTAVAGEIADTLTLLDRYPADRDLTLATALRTFELPMRILPNLRLAPPQVAADDDLAAALAAKIDRPTTLDWSSDSRAVLIHIQLDDGVLVVEAPRKRLYSSTVYIFVLWVVGTALLLFGIAALFLRNQVRAIRRLGAAAEAFGLGRDRGPIKLEGATEVRQAATAFNRMQARIQRFLAQRTEMLAGVSHDLRTPLTRLRLALAMLPRSPELEPDLEDMTTDLAEMERMIAGYLAFARGEGDEQAQPVELDILLADIAATARRAGTAVELDSPHPLTLNLRPDAARRAVTNLVDNARRHAAQIRLSVRPEGRHVSVLVDDNGPGIPPERRESVFRAYESGADGTGLGLTIARDIARAHGGEIHLEQSPLGGLRARLRLPV